MGKKVAAAVVVIITFIITLDMGCVETPQRRFGNMKLFSSAFEDNRMIPSEYTCDGLDVSPPLSFRNIPENTKSLALIMDDPDAPMGTWVHWLVWNISANKTSFSKGENITYPQGKNDFGDFDYGGPCPPSGTHRYFFKLYALDIILKLNKGSTKKQLELAMSGHIIEEAQLIGTYER
ncbi:Phosphatidylethanolamine-binding protein [uncultured archaeon]|nr:Phosphatidylethanolamine-binding protein [uncultured archaeon]